MLGRRGRRERRVRVVARRWTRRDNPDALRLAATAVKLAQALDHGAPPGAEEELKMAISNLLACSDQPSVLDRIRADRSERRARPYLLGDR